MSVVASPGEQDGNAFKVNYLGAIKSSSFSIGQFVFDHPLGIVKNHEPLEGEAELEIGPELFSHFDVVFDFTTMRMELRLPDVKVLDPEASVIVAGPEDSVLITAPAKVDGGELILGVFQIPSGGRAIVKKDLSSLNHRNGF